MEKLISRIPALIDAFETSSIDVNDIFYEISEVRSSSDSWLQDTIELEEESLPINNDESLIENSTDEAIVTSGSEAPIINSIAENNNSHYEERLLLKKDIFFQQSDDYIKDIYKLLNYSLLIGEYIYNVNIKTELEGIEDRLSTTLNLTNSFHLELQTKISEFISAVKIGCSSYKIFIKRIENEYSLDKVEYLFSSDQQIRREFNKSTLSKYSENLWRYLVNNIDLSFYDHFFSSENRQFEGLYTIEKVIEELDILEFVKVTKVIKFKISYLEHKWKARKQQENPSAIHYSIDGNTNTLEEYQSDNSKLIDWSKLIDSHYELFNNWKHETQKRIKAIKNSELSTLNTIQIHQLIKYNKDVHRNYQKLKEISSHLLKKQSDVNTNFYDKYALNIISNYALNNAFSSYIEKTDNIYDIKEEYNKTKRLLKGEINNFFLDYKYLNVLINILSKKSEEVTNLQFLDEYEKLITDECGNKLDEYFLSKEWSKTNNNYIFLLPFSECQVPIDSFNIDELPNIFIASSFILPAVNNQIDKQYIEIKQKFKSLSFQIDSIKRIRKDLEDIKDLKSEIEKRDFKSIEIISIFTAIITFVLSSIPAFKFVESVWQSLLFMLSLASALGIFIILILFSTRGFKNNWIGIIYVFVLFIIAIVGYNSLSEFEKKEVKLGDNISKSVDSISLKKVDSILKSKKAKP
ncbi:hypothetical protein Q765_20520 [Flavobacterium rivuli WB 3.3-2 = DSM 21788]|uniref:Uncharacterized protein n=1 Tax=Flavobacterium rivuli WB 3.3-2 = DSM 21788 TaxID=1121895 RepID=A0A0A2M8P9_9FLAO|nr:hypothetical protein [Flavobacterium rivuli]KGO84645.1 hypothetical protein Q765_20520 [Flavobacterium rivuli WB 3.3-2 = DSM 21788]